MTSIPPRAPRMHYGLDLSTPDGAEFAEAARELTSALRMWRYCPRRDCRRARDCVDPHVCCYCIHYETIRAKHYQAILAELARLDAEG